MDRSTLAIAHLMIHRNWFTRSHWTRHLMLTTPACLAVARLVLGVIAVIATPATLFGQEQPNIILINLDDADAEMFELPYSNILYPHIMGLAADGMTFTNLHVTTPLCGPSRACLYRAQYAHNTGVRVNRPRTLNANGFDGGFRYYRQQGYFENDLSVWMHDAGYRTMMVGKYLHGDFEKYVPPGWDDFFYYVGARYYGTYRFTNAESPAGKTDQLPETSYRTTAETNDAVNLIRRHVARNNGQPFFLNINPLGPHQAQSDEPDMIEPKMTSWWPNILPPFSRAFNEFDIQDKRGPLSELRLMSAAQELESLIHYRERALATRSVDELVGAIRATVDELGLADNTYIFLTSDNGFALGHNRFRGKGVPLERASRVPCLVIGPGVPAGTMADQLIGHIDLGPTMVKLAGGQVPGFVDGRSFAELLKPGGLDRFPSFRRALLIENWESVNLPDQPNLMTASNSIRFEKSIFVEWANGEREFYDLRNDPDQLDNVYDTEGIGKQVWFDAWLRVLKGPHSGTSARFSDPFDVESEIGPEAGLQGLAEDPVGVDSIRLAIRDLHTGQFWNGDQWQDNLVQLPASLANRGGQLSGWSFDSLPANDEATSGEFVAWAWAYDSHGNYGPPNVVIYRYSHDGTAID